MRKCYGKNMYMYLLIIIKNIKEQSFCLLNPLFFASTNKYLVKIITTGDGGKWGRRYICCGICFIDKTHE